MRKGFWMLLICVSLMLSGCGNSQGNDSEKKDNIVIEGNDVISDEMVEKGLQKLAEDAYKAVKEKNTAAFKALFVDAKQQEAKINEMYQYFSNAISSGYNDWDYIYVMSHENVYFCQIIASGCSGTYPSTHLQYSSYGLLLTYTDKEWKIGLDENTEWLIDVFPNEAKNAYKNGRDFVMFNNYSWVHEDCVYTGAVDVSVYAAWENEDGSVSFLINYKNGTDAVRSITHISVSLYSETLKQEIVSLEADENEMLAPGKGATYVITTKPEDVRVRDWGEQVSYKINNRNR